ncbi:hypothetical protein AB0H76_25115 [Nocardia sp. NPDC050712]|uniref:hypothetical protein n=1 Tax=Nocardia sp. NPDC050712 TaxID=3155518 RepID=UPI0033EF0F78
MSFQQPYPAPPGFAPHAYGPPPASGATGIIATLLALAGGLMNGGLAIAGVVSITQTWQGPLTMQPDGNFQTEPSIAHIDGVEAAWCAGTGITALLLLLGGILLLLRSPVGRVLVASGSVLALLLAVLPFLFSAMLLDSAMLADSSILLLLGIGGFFPFLTLVLACIPPTGRWIATRPRR